MIMNLYHLKYFQDAAQTGQISEAARLNHVSQSAISQAIKTLELTFGCQLIEHKRNRFQLTDEGRLVHKYSKPVFEAVENFKNQIDLGKKGYSGELCIGSTLSLGANFLPPYLSHIKKNYPAISLKVRLGDQETVKNWLRDGEIEVAVVLDDHLRESLFHSRTIGRGQFYIVQGAKHKGRLEAEGIIVSRSDSLDVKALKKQFKSQFGSDLKISMEIVSWDAVKSYLLTGHGIGLCPDYVVREELKRGLLKKSAIKYSAINYELQLLNRKAVVPSKNAKMFFDLVGS
jgi:LysR family transcriptional regulator, carnitine catabolism transcriptional activator